MSEVTNAHLDAMTADMRANFNQKAIDDGEKVQLIVRDNPTLSGPDQDEVDRIYDELKPETAAQLQARGGPLIWPDKLSI